MTYKTVQLFDEQTGITTTSDSFILDCRSDISISASLTSGTPVTGAKIQFTIDTAEKIKSDTAMWIDSPSGNHLLSFAESSLGHASGVRLIATDGTWTLQVRQAIDTHKAG